MQLYADIYLLQSHSTCFGCHSTHHQEYVAWSGPIMPRWREAAIPVLWPVPEVAVTVFSTPDDGCCDTRNM